MATSASSQEKKPFPERASLSSERVASPAPEQAPSAPTKETTPAPRERGDLGEEEKKPSQMDEGAVDKAIDSLKLKLRKPKRSTVVPQVRDELTIRVEAIMAEGLTDAYKALTPLQQQEFKIKGEETAVQIRQILKKTHGRIKKIFQLLFAWLRLLPGVNVFFLEQEAKIKADKIIALQHLEEKKK